MFRKLKYSAQDYDFEPAQKAVEAGKVPTKRQLYQNRQNFGVNLGSIFVLEKFIHGKFFINDTNVELDAISAQVKQNGVDKVREELENHWKTFVNDDDWRYLQEAGVTSVRVPVGYWEVGNGQFCEGTPFAAISAVYANAWTIYTQYYIEKAAQYNISVLVDLHAVPGGANTGDHSGVKLDKPGFWESSDNQLAAMEILKFLASDLQRHDNVAGLQIVNEAVFDYHSATQGKFYKAAIHKIRKVNSEIPIVISDGWDPDYWISWIKEGEDKLGNSQDLGVVIDVHIYRCFSDEDKSKSPDQIIAELDKTVLQSVENKADVIVGEYSGVLDGQTWDKFHGNRDEKVGEFLRKESQLFKERASGSYFWTYKFEWGDGGEWGFRPMLEKGNIPRRKRNVDSFPSAEKRDELLNQKFSEHSNYWDSNSNGEKFEHDRYKEGFLTGWNDTAEFAKLDASTIGRKHSWALARRADHVAKFGSGKHLWEWDQGFAAGCAAFEHEAGI